jgi:hypothetical protein
LRELSGDKTDSRPLNMFLLDPVFRPFNPSNVQLQVEVLKNPADAIRNQFWLGLMWPMTTLQGINPMAFRRQLEE